MLCMCTCMFSFYECGVTVWAMNITTSRREMWIEMSKVCILGLVNPFKTR